MRVSFTDKLPKGKALKTPEGFVRGLVPVAMTGVFPYSSDSIGLSGPRRMVNVLKSPATLKNAQSIESAKGKPVTREHPSVANGVGGFLDATNARTAAIGASGDLAEVVEEDGEHVLYLSLSIFDEKAVEDVKKGLISEVSMGYDAVIRPIRGEYNGVPYEFEQQDIHYNHIALVAQGRMGSKCSVPMYDGKEKNGMKTIIINGIVHEVPDEVAQEHARLVKVADESAKVSEKVKELETELGKDKALLALAEQKAATEAARAAAIQDAAEKDDTGARVELLVRHAHLFDKRENWVAELSKLPTPALKLEILKQKGVHVPEGLEKMSAEAQKGAFAVFDAFFSNEAEESNAEAFLRGRPVFDSGQKGEQEFVPFTKQYFDFGKSKSETPGRS